MSSKTEQCSHYQRKCSFMAPCCKKEFTCRFCHDDAENHKIDRRKVEEIMCLQCRKRQEVSRNCTDCGVLFGNYSCLICRMYDDVDKEQFHCDGCGICRVGGAENFFHCKKCDMCLGIGMKETHKCLENISRKNCPVCLEDLHTSRLPTHVPKCGHLLHVTCFKGMLTHGQSSCPVCNASLIDMAEHWEEIDAVVAETPMPHIYQNYHVNVLCRDCHQESNTLFHVVGLKCKHCGAYNTTRIGGDDPLPEDIAIGDMVISPDDDSWETVSEEGSEANEDNTIDLNSVDHNESEDD